jgi:hypothetical protein
MLVIAYLVLMAQTDGNAGETRYFNAKGERGSYAASGPGSELWGKVGAAEADAQSGGGVGPRAAMMKCSKQPSSWRSMARAMFILAVAILPPFSSPILVRAMHGLAVSNYACFSRNEQNSTSSSAHLISTLTEAQNMRRESSVLIFDELRQDLLLRTAGGPAAM